MADVSISGVELMKRVLTHTKNISESELRLHLRDSAREFIRSVGIIRDTARFESHNTATEFILPAAGREFCRISDISGRLPSAPQVRQTFPTRWKNYFSISDDAETGAWTPPQEIASVVSQLPYELEIEYVMTIKMNDDLVPHSIISQYFETIILKTLTKLPMVYLADERRNYMSEYYASVAKVRRRLDSGGVFWVRTAPYWGDSTQAQAFGSGNYGLPLT